MLWFFLRRLGLLIVALAVASVIIFLLLRLLPGDLAGVIGGVEATPEQIAKIREDLGLEPATDRAVLRVDRRRAAR